MSPRFDPEVLSKNGLACPYCKSSPERYRSFTLCHPETGWTNLGRTIEHVKRCHTPSYNCVHCGLRWLASEYNDKTLPPVRIAHLEVCMLKHAGLAREYMEDEPEIMTEEGEKRFQGLRNIRKDNEKKLDELYKACGKDLPETYRASSSNKSTPQSTAQAQLTSLPYADVRPLEDLPAQSQLPEIPTPSETGTNHSPFLNGFNRPDPDPTLGPSRTLSWELRNGNTTSIPLTDSMLVVPSGPDAPGEQDDSGYGGSAGQEALCPALDAYSFSHDAGGSSPRWNACLPEFDGNFDLGLEGAHNWYPSVIDESSYFESG